MKFEAGGEFKGHSSCIMQVIASKVSNNFVNSCRFCYKYGFANKGKGCGKIFNYERSGGVKYITSDKIKEICQKEGIMHIYKEVMREYIDYKLSGGDR